MIPIFILIVVRIIPLITSGTPLGYDSGLYKHLFDQNQLELINGSFDTKNWLGSMYLPGTTILSTILLNLGYSSTFIVTYFLILLDIIVLINLYILCKYYFTKEVALIATYLYSVSTVSFYVFSYVYYKNILGISMLLIIIYLFEKKKYFLATLMGGLLGGIHRPSFAIFSITFFLNWLDKKEIKLFISGIAIIIISILFYLNNVYDLFASILIETTMSVNRNISSGTFMDLRLFLYESLILVMFFIIGLFYIIKKRKYNYLFIWLVLNIFLITFKIFFYNRIIIFLNVVIIIYSAVGISILLKNLKHYQQTMLIILIVISTSGVIISESTNNISLISKYEYETIKLISTYTPEDSKIFYNNKYYSAWVIGWSNRTTISHGVFINNNYTQTQWNNFFNGNLSIIAQETGNKYFFIGRFGTINKYNYDFYTSQYPINCFSEVYTNEDSTLIKYNNNCKYNIN
ncbi:MAG: hypothetical protein ACOC16_03140 [Nanoarchaeota archaeon]